VGWNISYPTLTPGQWVSVCPVRQSRRFLRIIQPNELLSCLYSPSTQGPLVIEVLSTLSQTVAQYPAVPYSNVASSTWPQEVVDINSGVHGDLVRAEWFAFLAVTADGGLCTGIFPNVTEDMSVGAGSSPGPVYYFGNYMGLLCSSPTTVYGPWVVVLVWAGTSPDSIVSGYCYLSPGAVDPTGGSPPASWLLYSVATVVGNTITFSIYSQVGLSCLTWPSTLTATTTDATDPTVPLDWQIEGFSCAPFSSLVVVLESWDDPADGSFANLPPDAGEYDNVQLSPGGKKALTDLLAKIPSPQA
jgi:hypothetical protein